MMKALNFVTSAFVFLFLACSYSRAYAAGIPVMDLTNFVENLITATQQIQSVIKQAEQISNEVKQISNQVTQIGNQDFQISLQQQSLRLMGSPQYNELLQIADQNIQAIQDLTSMAQELGFNVSQVRDQFDAIFPSNSDWQNMPITQFKDEFRQWDRNLLESAKMSADAQTIINRVSSNYDTINDILRQSQSADGEVRQLQVSNQGLALLSSQLGDITRTLVAEQRVASMAAATAASQMAAQQQAGTRLRNGYGDMGPEPQRLAEFPEVKSGN
ncbi:putative Conjugal transfer/entry exclusion protein-like protein [uncultured Desulfobacterium sp.]|uniref:Putative Conjugal transfer/entry exclusion protein-like protein n=1 Tax=uncultured Desulfobacterium sp. TaxID=201089 RepID=A0A445MSI9_9BACT|nr:putative Conjugal transfer/entry exclusion protein-like protein [uncultured Desulfobacterium sp.]